MTDPRIYPPIIPTLAPVPTAGRQPAVMTASPPPDVAEYVPSNPELFRDGVFAPYRAAQLAGPFPDLAADADATVQFPDKLAAAALSSPAGTALYQRMYLAHPSPAAHFLASYCDNAVRSRRVSCVWLLDVKAAC